MEDSEDDILEFDANRLIIAMRPANEGVEMSDVGDDEPIIVTFIGTKSYLLTLVSTLATLDNTPDHL